MNNFKTNKILGFKLKDILLSFLLVFFINAHAQVRLEKEVKITDVALFFDGNKVGGNATNNNTAKYDYRFGPKISAHGDCIKKYKEFIFTTWYRGDKFDRHMMLSRYNTRTGVLKTIEFSHRHTGLNGKWWIGESHNTIAIGISPKDETIHMLYDMHSYNNTGLFRNDYFRYSYSIKNAAVVSDTDFKLNLFVPDTPGDYTHVSLNGVANPSEFQDLTYPNFFLNDGGDLLMHMRRGGNDNGAYVFSKYDAITSKWETLTQFNHLNASNRGQSHNWGLYGSMKYVNGKLGVGFQVRSANSNDKYEYQNGFYYAYSDDQSGKTNWKDHEGQGFSIPFANPNRIKIYEPGNLVSATGKNEVYIVKGFDWTVTDRGDVHIIGSVRDKKNNVTKNVHTYKKTGTSNFITTTNFSGADQLYTYGNEIYIITIKNGRPFIQKAEGGNNNFQTIYQPTGGKIFRHGVPYIYEGKLYYYMQESKSGTKQPLYLQIIDLGIENTPSNSVPTVSVTSPANNSVFTLGETIILKASASDPDGNLDKVNFKVNDVFYRSVNSRPFESTFTPTQTGTYKIAAKAFDNENLQAEDFVTITVVNLNNPPVVSISSPINNATYTIGETIALKASVIDPDGNLDKVNFKINNSFYRSVSDRPFASTFTPTVTGSYKIAARAFDRENLQAEDFITINVVRRQASSRYFQDVNLENIIVYPNPSISGIFYLSKETKWEVLSITGRKISEGVGNEINLQGAEKGIYYVVTNDVSIKVIIE